ncbi:MAG TPA: hypothetical protein VNW89_16325, partial [Stellaceae bacterium]|nr:hypothetical protein [Stellaceae bacterium]
MDIADARGARRGDRGHEAFRHTGGGERALEAGNIGGNRLPPGIAQGCDADRVIGRPRPGRNTGIGIGIGRGEPRAVAPVGKARQYHLAGTRPPRRHLVEAGPAHFEPAQP